MESVLACFSVRGFMIPLLSLLVSGLSLLVSGVSLRLAYIIHNDLAYSYIIIKSIEFTERRMLGLCFYLGVVKFQNLGKSPIAQAFIIGELKKGNTRKSVYFKYYPKLGIEPSQTEEVIFLEPYNEICGEDLDFRVIFEDYRGNIYEYKIKNINRTLNFNFHTGRRPKKLSKRKKKYLLKRIAFEESWLDRKTKDVMYPSAEKFKIFTELKKRNIYPFEKQR